MRVGGHYATPPWVTRALLRRIGPLGKKTFIDAGCGGGAITVELLRSNPEMSVLGVEKNRQLALRCGRAVADFGSRARVVVDDFLGPSTAIGIDGAIFNPPFELTLAFVQRAFMLLEPNLPVCCLGRINWLGGGASPKALAETIEKHEWLRANAPEMLVLPRRPSFVKSKKDKKSKTMSWGTDATEYCWFLWGDGTSPGTWSFADAATCRDLPRKRRGGQRAIRR